MPLADGRARPRRCACSARCAQAGLRALLDPEGRSFKSRMKQADKLGRALRGDPGRRRDRAGRVDACATWRGSAQEDVPRGRRSSNTSRRRRMAEPLGDLVRTHYCGELRDDARRQDRHPHGLGGHAPRPRRRRVRRPARPRGDLPGRGAARGLEGGPRRRRPRALASTCWRWWARSRRAPPDTVNPNLDTGKVEVLAREIRVLSEAKTPVFPIEDEIDTHEEIRLKYRYLDLRRPRLQQQPHAAPPGHDGGAALPGRAGLLRDRDPDARASRRPRARATTSCPRASTTAASTRCRSRRSCSSSS